MKIEPIFIAVLSRGGSLDGQDIEPHLSFLLSGKLCMFASADHNHG